MLGEFRTKIGRDRRRQAALAVLDGYVVREWSWSWMIEGGLLAKGSQLPMEHKLDPVEPKC